MAKDFFGNLGQALSKTAKELSGRAEDAYETQRQVVTDMRGFVRYNEETGIRNILWGDLQESSRCKVKVVIDYV